jgi:hypothetical protein
MHALAFRPFNIFYPLKELTEGLELEMEVSARTPKALSILIT